MMSGSVHKIYISTLVIITAVVAVYLVYHGLSYYILPLEERVFHPDHVLLKPSGFMGHGIGILGSFLMLTGIFSYMARKRFRSMSRIGILKHWLEFHIFLCTLGPLLILFHTSYKFGGLVAISFWSMVAVFFSGIIGRFIYIRIPRSIEGRELSLKEINAMRSDLALTIKNKYSLDEESFMSVIQSTRKGAVSYIKNPIIRFLRIYSGDRRTIRSLKKSLVKLPAHEARKIVSLVKDDIKMNRRIGNLETMQNLFRYWHVVHLPFALVMLVIMVIHIGVTIVFGYRWIF